MLIGHTDCTDPQCGAQGIPVHRTAGGKIYAACHRCEMTQQPRAGSVAHRRLLKRTELCESESLDHGGEGAPVPIPIKRREPSKRAPAPEPANAAAAAAPGFQLGAL